MSEQPEGRAKGSEKTAKGDIEQPRPEPLATNPDRDEFQRAAKLLADKLAHYEKNPDKSGVVVSITPAPSSKWELSPG